ncbi:pilus protein [Escherichia coli]|nr:pilus protein [Escherichia coli]
MKNGVIHTTSFHYKYHAQDSCLHPGGLLPGCRERRSRRDRGGATGTVAASQGFASGMEGRQGDARERHKQENNKTDSNQSSRKKKNSSSSRNNNIISNRQMTGLKRQKPTAERPRNERGGA